jgi:hypothetical protein
MHLSVRARLSLSRMISQQQSSLDDSEIWDRILKVITVPQEELDQFVLREPGMPMRLNEPAMDAPGPVDIQFEHAERRKLLGALKAYNGYFPADAAWNRRFIAQLEESLLEAPVSISENRKKSGAR